MSVRRGLKNTNQKCAEGQVVQAYGFQYQFCHSGMATADPYLTLITLLAAFILKTKEKCDSRAIYNGALRIVRVVSLQMPLPYSCMLA